MQSEEDVENYIYWTFIDLDPSGPLFNAQFFRDTDDNKNRGAKKFREANL